MSIEELESKLHRQLKACSEAEIQNEHLNEEIHSYFEEYSIEPKQLSAFISQKEHFCEQNWEQLQQEKKKLEDRLERDLKNIANPFRLKKVYKQRKVENHWLFVR